LFHAIDLRRPQFSIEVNQEDIYIKSDIDFEFEVFSFIKSRTDINPQIGKWMNRKVETTRQNLKLEGCNCIA
jgi:hypothetical protein